MSMTPIVLILLILFLIALAAAAIFLYVYWWLMQRPNPKLNGTLQAPFLEQPVEVRRDRHGVPHVYAQGRADLFRAQGWLHAQDRMWQMEQSRRTAAGRLAEVFGAPALDADRFCRIVGFRRSAEQEATALDPDTRRILDWYAEGVNAYIATHKGRLAAELNLLRVQVEPWQAVDTLAFFKATAWSMSTNWESELTRVRLMEELDPYTAADLEPDYPEKNPLILEAAGSAQHVRMLYTAGLLLNQYENVRTWLGGGEGQGSNSWVLAPKNSLNRRPLLCADPHLNVQLPSQIYEMHLICPDYEVSGATYPGLPGVVIGHNHTIAWGATNGLADTQDLFVEQRHPDHPTQFAYNGAWEQAQVIEETIQVRRASPHVESVVVTRHGPLISGFVRFQPSRDPGQPASDPLPLALQWTGHAPSHTLRALLAINQATDWPEFELALADWAIPVQNFTFADARGNIGYKLAGTIPQRMTNLGLTPAPGWDAAYAWGPPILAAELPSLYNPESGKIVSANNKIAGDDYPYFLGVEFDPGWRAARIEEFLNEKDRHTIRDMQEAQQDNFSKYAQAFTPWFTLLRSEDPWEKTALQLLRKWNWQMDTDSAAALCFHYILGHLMQMVWGDKLGPALEGYLGVSGTPLFPLHGFKLRAETKLLELINSHEESFWYADVAAGRQRTRDELLQEALTLAMKSIRAVHGDSSLRWAWGRTHQVRFAHPLGRARFVGGFFDRGPIPVGGDGTTPNQTRAANKLPPGLVQIIPAYRQVYEVGTWDRAETVLAGGQSGHPLSRLYDDQAIMWREGVYHLMPWSREAVEKVTEYRLMLEP